MKLTTVLLFVATMQLSANSFAQKITLKLDNVSLDKVFREIKRQTGYLFLYNNEEINKVGKVSINQHDVGIENVMDQVLSASAFSYRIVDMTIILTKRLEPTNPTTSVQPPTTLMGIVTDPQGNPLADVSITIKGSTKGTTTDSKGMFTIKEFEITSIELPRVDFRVVCTTGTYIRSLAFDFGNELGCGGYLSKLIRTRIGAFKLDETMSLDNFIEAVNKIKPLSS
jgi:hypothetical protein